MARRLPFHFVDVFATRPLTGNALSLVRDADGLGGARMPAMARDFNQSGPRSCCAIAAWAPPCGSLFYPGRVEVGGAGRNALGASLWLDHGRVGADGGLCTRSPARCSG